jgi:hypothetical protein
LIRSDLDHQVRAWAEWWEASLEAFWGLVEERLVELWLRLVSVQLQEQRKERFRERQRVQSLERHSVLPLAT